MNFRKFQLTMKTYGLRWLSIGSMLMLGAVSLTACSNAYDAAALWAEQARLLEARAEVVAEVKAEAAPQPDIPPFIKVCLTHGAARNKVNQKKAMSVQGKGPAPTADELVAAELQSTEERNKCTLALLEWYRSVQKQQKKAGPKIASAAK